MTNFEKFKSMTIDEMADYIINESEVNAIYGEKFCKSDCGTDDGCPHAKKCRMEWLESEVEE